MTASTPRSRRPTATSNFGVGRRESHDASAFYDRFVAPNITDESLVVQPSCQDTLFVGDARDMTPAQVADHSVARVVTSPPYFAGKEYEEALGVGHVPETFSDYLAMLHDVFAVCFDKLESGGRIAVNVANLGRKPYRSLAADVIRILEDLGFLLRGEIVWRKSQAAGGSCAWGTYQRPGNPVLRDVTERIVVASKGRFDRAIVAGEREARGLPAEGTISMDEFMEATTDLWEIPAESARRVGHPAPFPVALPRRLIDLYTYRGDLVLDPFMGSGTTAIAAVESERHYVGFDTDPAYVAHARERIRQAEISRDNPATGPARHRVTVRPGPAEKGAAPSPDEAASRGQKASELAGAVLVAAGFHHLETAVTIADLGIGVSFRGLDADGRTWLFELVGAYATTRAGLARSDVLVRTIGKAALLRSARDKDPERSDLGPLIILTTDLPPVRSGAGRSLELVTGADQLVHDVVRLLDETSQDTLTRWAGRPTA